MTTILSSAKRLMSAAVMMTSLLLIIIIVLLSTSSLVAASCNINIHLLHQFPYPQAGTLIDLSHFLAFQLNATTSVPSERSSEMLLFSGDNFIRNKKQKVSQAYYIVTRFERGIDEFGPFEEQVNKFSLNPTTDETQCDFSFAIRQYRSRREIVVFKQTFYNAMTETADPTWGEFGVSSSFPSFATLNSTCNNKPENVGFTFFSGFMAGSMYPQYGQFIRNRTKDLIGGKSGSGLFTLYDRHASISVSLCPLTSFMSSGFQSAEYELPPSLDKHQQINFGVLGNAKEFPKGYSIEHVATCAAGGVNRGVRHWGSVMKQKYSRSAKNDKDEKKQTQTTTTMTTTTPHERDVTLQSIQYVTDNGAYYYYDTHSFKNYEEVLLAVKADAVKRDIPFQSMQCDSWWYYRSNNASSGVPLAGLWWWSAPRDVFPNGIRNVFEQTKWPIMAHSRYFSPNNVYASNPEYPIGPTNYTGKKFPFTFGKKTGAGVPTPGTGFWEYFFDLNDDWGLTVYEQDWLSLYMDDIDDLTANVTMGDAWLTEMGRAAQTRGVSIQLCMSYPRAVLASLFSEAFTQVRASNDFQPQSSATFFDDYYQWRIGESSLWTDAIGLAPSKDGFWTSSVPQFAPHYNTVSDTYETRNRLEALVATMSNGVYQVGDRVGFADRSLIMKSCTSQGKLLRPSQAAAPLDSYFAYKAFIDPSPPPRQTPVKNNNLTTNDPVLHFTLSKINGAGGAVVFNFLYLLVVTGDRVCVSFDELVGSANLVLPPASSSSLPALVQLPSYFLAFEHNTTQKLVKVVPPSYHDADQSKSIIRGIQRIPEVGEICVDNANEWNFNYYTFVPVFDQASFLGFTPTWILLGETEKWIAASPQRFDGIMYFSDGTSRVAVQGALGEIVNLVFVDGATNSKFVRAACKVGMELSVTFEVDESGTVNCRM